LVCASGPVTAAATTSLAGGSPDSENGSGAHVAAAEEPAGVASRWVWPLFWLGSRIREEVEDMWAEAQRIRRGDQK
jgi:hypothetical protein